MRKTTLFTFLSLLCLYAYGQGGNRPITFAWFSDTHLNSFEYAEDDLRQGIEDVNANPLIDFTIISGDLTEFGDTKEFLLLKEILDDVEKPCLVIPGNHDVNWSENGCTVFNGIFGASNFCYDLEGVRFIGCGAGPSLRMGPPHIPREEILWLDSIVCATPPDTPIIFVNHFPIDQALSNWYEVIDILNTRNTQAILCGHGHVNRAYNFEGIPGIMGRSSLRRKDPIGGYNLVTIAHNQLSVSERIIKSETKPAWHSIALSPLKWEENATYPRPDYSINTQYPQIRPVWKIKDSTDVASQADTDGNLFVYTNTAGVVYALDVHTGEERWRFTTGNKIFAAPFITPKEVVVASCDGFIYSINKENGDENWKYNTHYPIVACPLVVDSTIYVGSSNGKCYSLQLEDGSLNWICEGLQGYMESRPAANDTHIFIGTWGAMLYAIDRRNGEKAWEFDTRRGRYFSPGACWPIVVHDQVIVISSDYAVRSFVPDTGDILWQSDEAKGRESIGISPNMKTLYIKGIKNNITAVDISGKQYHPQWEIAMPYESNFIPTRMGTTDELVYIPTEFGVVHAIKSDGGGIAWSYKVSHSAVTSFNAIDNNRLIVMSMDGTVTCLQY